MKTSLGVFRFSLSHRIRGTVSALALAMAVMFYLIVPPALAADDKKPKSPVEVKKPAAQKAAPSAAQPQSAGNPAPSRMAKPKHDDDDDGRGGDDDDDGGGGGDKVTICHRGHTIRVSRKALAAHLRHGDTLGPCDMTPRKKHDDDDD